MAGGKLLFHDQGGGPSIPDNRDRWTTLIWDRWTRSLRDIATHLASEELLNISTQTAHQKTLLFVGSKCVAKDICHIWELGGGTLFTSVLDNGHSLTSYGPLGVVLLLDLSELNQLWSCFETLLENVKHCLKNTHHHSINESSQRILSDHPDSSMMDPFPVPIVIIGGKYDIFQEFEPEKKKIVCRCLRYVSHILCGTLIYYSSKEAALVKRVKDVLNHHAFGSPQIKTVCHDYNKALCVPCGSDFLESIEGVGATTKCTLDKVRHIYTTHFPQDISNVSSTVLDDPVNDPNFREPLVDALRRQKDEELERYFQEMERREKRNVMC